MTELVVVTRSAEETRALGARLAGALRPGDLVVLAGGLGAGKTVFAQGVAAGLGVEGPVVSPTFTLVREYEGRLPLVHADVYRLDQLGEVVDLAMEESFDGQAVTLVEWGDAVLAVLDDEHLDVVLEPGPVEEPDTRRLLLRPHGPRWTERREALVRAWTQEERP